MRLLRKVFYPELPLHFPTRMQAISKTFQTGILRKQGKLSLPRAHTWAQRRNEAGGMDGLLRITQVIRKCVAASGENGS